MNVTCEDVGQLIPAAHWVTRNYLVQLARMD